MLAADETVAGWIQNDDDLVLPGAAETVARWIQNDDDDLFLLAVETVVGWIQNDDEVFSLLIKLSQGEYKMTTTTCSC